MAKIKSATQKMKQQLRKRVQPNKWGYGAVLKTSITLTFISLAINTYIMTAHGEQPVTANFAFRECVRATRRAKTLATYARKRGPMMKANVVGYDKLATAGVTHLEDAHGGLISGPLGLWKSGEIYAYEYSKGPSITLTLQNISLSAIHWNNGNSNPCVDRQVYIGAQKAPQEDASAQFINVITGFLNVDCTSRNHKGYVIIIKSITHGGSLIGRIYEAEANFDSNHFPAESSACIQTIDVKLTELGAIMEDREFSSSAYYQTKLLLFFIPLLLWGFIFVRLSSVKVVINMAIAQGGGQTTETLSSAHSSQRSDDTDGSSGGDIMKDRKEQTKEKHLNSGIVELWRLPMLHIFYIALYLLLTANARNDNGIMNDFIPAFDSFKIDYDLHAIVLVSQEIVSWLLSAFSSIVPRDNERSWMVQQRALVYTYQYRDGYLRVIKLFNYLLCVSLILDTVNFIPHDMARITLLSICGVIVLVELVMVVSTQFDHPFGSTPACTIGGLSGGFSIMTRQMTTYLASQEVKGLAEFDKNEESIPGMEFVGALGDAITLARPDYVLEGLLNGEVIQVSIIESSLSDANKYLRFKSVGNHQFELKRHFLLKGKQNISLV